MLHQEDKMADGLISLTTLLSAKDNIHKFTQRHRYKHVIQTHVPISFQLHLHLNCTVKIVITNYCKYWYYQDSGVIRGTIFNLFLNDLVCYQRQRCSYATAYFYSIFFNNIIFISMQWHNYISDVNNKPNRLKIEQVMVI